MFTEEKILEYVQQQGAANLSQIARRFALHNCAARGFVDDLVLQGKVRVIPTKETGGTKIVIPTGDDNGKN